MAMLAASMSMLSESRWPCSPQVFRLVTARLQGVFQAAVPLQVHASLPVDVFDEEAAQVRAQRQASRCEGVFVELDVAVEVEVGQVGKVGVSFLRVSVSRPYLQRRKAASA